MKEKPFDTTKLKPEVEKKMIPKRNPINVVAVNVTAEEYGKSLLARLDEREKAGKTAAVDVDWIGHFREHLKGKASCFQNKNLPLVEFHTKIEGDKELLEDIYGFLNSNNRGREWKLTKAIHNWNIPDEIELEHCLDLIDRTIEINTFKTKEQIQNELEDDIF